MAVDFNNTEVAFKHKTNSDLRFAQLIFKLMGIPVMTGAMTKLTLFALKINLPISWVVKLTIFKQFCGGTSITDSELLTNYFQQMELKRYSTIRLKVKKRRNHLIT